MRNTPLFILAVIVAATCCAEAEPITVGVLSCLPAPVEVCSYDGDDVKVLIPRVSQLLEPGDRADFGCESGQADGCKIFISAPSDQHPGLCANAKGHTLVPAGKTLVASEATSGSQPEVEVTDAATRCELSD